MNKILIAISLALFCHTSFSKSVIIEANLLGEEKKQQPIKNIHIKKKRKKLNFGSFDISNVNIENFEKKKKIQPLSVIVNFDINNGLSETNLKNISLFIQKVKKEKWNKNNYLIILSQGDNGQGYSNSNSIASFFMANGIKDSNFRIQLEKERYNDNTIQIDAFNEIL